jgi:hypothetical protein
MNDSPDQLEQPPKSTRFPFQRRQSAPKDNKYRQTHGLISLKKAVNTLGNRALDKRTVAGRALAEWREDLIRDLGGDVSTQQDAIISLAIKTKLLLDSIDVWLLQQDTLIIKRKKAVIPAVQQRQVLADALARYMSMLGLARKAKHTSLSEMLSSDDDTSDDTHSVTSEQSNK